ncbi:helix-turn-helix transcriptional regulator [Streptosporangium oxazolinicum]|uniref:Helix-turn-helix transcriptional regulator n=1 Tax=Streptosporangium oxazolinicum TaxID=909287 RepID=A0ABP8ALF4_9ACTN
MSAKDQRLELAHFLRKNRERVTPKDVGLPTGSRRRTPGLRREEVAILAGLSPTWYTYLEQARDIAPSPAALERVATVLRLSSYERQYLRRLSERSRQSSHASEGNDQTENQWTRIVESLNPVPAYVTTCLCDIISWNEAADEWYSDFSELAKERRNIVLWMLTSPVSRKCFVDWETEARELVARFRTAAVGWYGDPRLTELIENLNESSPHFRRWWEEHHVLGPNTRSSKMRNTRTEIIDMTIIDLYIGHPNGEKIVIHVPATHTG